MDQFIVPDYINDKGYYWVFGKTMFQSKIESMVSNGLLDCGLKENLDKTNPEDLEFHLGEMDYSTSKIGEYTFLNGLNDAGIDVGKYYPILKIERDVKLVFKKEKKYWVRNGK